MASDDDDERSSEEDSTSPRLVISELLLCAMHYLKEDMPVCDIVSEFDTFYSKSEIESAVNVLLSLNVPFLKKNCNSTSRLTKENGVAKPALCTKLLIGEICRVLTESYPDNVMFVAADMDMMCHFPLSGSEAAHVATEIRSVYVKLSALENTCLKAISSVNDKRKVKKKTALSNVIENENQQQPPAMNGRSKVIIPSTLSSVSSAPAKLTSAADGAEKRGWNIVARKKRKPRPVIIGTDENATNEIKTVPATAVTSVFVSRCAPTTTTDNFRSLLEKKNWKIGRVQKRRASFDTYSTFRIDILRSYDEPEFEFFKPEHWPMGAFVKPFERRPYKPAVIK